LATVDGRPKIKKPAIPGKEERLSRLIPEIIY
jgi:hypothetical protein